MTTIQDDKEFMDKLIDVKEKSKGRKEESRCFTENAILLGEKFGK